MTDNYIPRTGKQLPLKDLRPNSAREKQLLEMIQKAIEKRDDLTDEELALYIWQLTRRY